MNSMDNDTPQTPVRSTRRLAVAGAAIGLLVGAAGVTTPAGAVTPTCKGASCNGKSPVTTLCYKDAYTVNEIVLEDHASGGTFSKTVVTLRYSPKCKASWSKVTSTAGGTAHTTKVWAWMMGFYTSTVKTRTSSGTSFSNMRAGIGTAGGKVSYNNGAVVDKTYVSAPG